MIKYNKVVDKVLGCALEVHKNLGPGLLESTYERCLAYELDKSGLKFELQKPIPVIYKEIKLDCGYRVDVMIEEQVILELKSVNKIDPVHEAQLLTYMKLAGVKWGFLLNFNVTRLKDGMKSFVL